MSMRSMSVAVALGSVFVIGCSPGSSPSGPSAGANSTIEGAAVHASASGRAATIGGRPDYTLAYYNGTVVTMNDIEVPQNPGPLTHAAADLYAVVYPANHALWPSPPQCNPCDHGGNGIDVPDFHDHVLDSIPGDPGHGEFNPLWHVFSIRPANGLAATQAAYAARLPMTSEEAVDAAIDAGVAVEVDTGHYFICAIVDDHAAKQ